MTDDLATLDLSIQDRLRERQRYALEQGSYEYEHSAHDPSNGASCSGYDAELDLRAADHIEKLEAELAAANATLDKLPVTADGKRRIPREYGALGEAWAEVTCEHATGKKTSKEIRCGSVCGGNDPGDECEVEFCAEQSAWAYLPVGICYSTHEVALAAAKKEAPDD